jgi:hypothetical protein
MTTNRRTIGAFIYETAPFMLTRLTMSFTRVQRREEFMTEEHLRIMYLPRPTNFAISHAPSVSYVDAQEVPGSAKGRRCEGFRIVTGW